MFLEDNNQAEFKKKFGTLSGRDDIVQPKLITENKMEKDSPKEIWTEDDAECHRCHLVVLFLMGNENKESDKVLER